MSGVVNRPSTAGQSAVNLQDYLLRLLGSPSLEGPNGVLRGPVVQRHRMALLALVALASRGLLSRDRLLGLLWPEAEPGRARHLLNMAVYSIRQHLGEDALNTEGDALRLNKAKVRVDVLEFENALERGEHAQAAESYSGAFLEGLALPNAVEFEHWQQREAARLEQLYYTALERSAESAVRNQDRGEAVRLWKQRLACTPTETRVVVQLMEALVKSGDRVAALQLASAHEQLVAVEFGISVGPEVKAFMQRLDIASPASQFPLPVQVPPVVTLPDATTRRPVFSGGLVHGLPDAKVGAAANSRARRRLIGYGLGLVAISTASIIGFRSLAERGIILVDDRVVVGAFENHTGDETLWPLGRMAADWITDGLQRIGMVQVTPSRTALQADRFVQQQLAARLIGDPVRALAEETGSAIVVSGNYFRAGNRLSFRAQITDARTGRQLSALGPVEVDHEAPMSGLNELQQRVMAGLAVAKELSPRTGIDYSTVQPPTFAAYREFIQGLERFIDVDFGRALTHFLRATAHDSAYLMPQLLAGITYINLGEFGKADSIATLLAVSRARLNVFQRYEVEYLDAFARQDWASLLRAGEELSRLAPQSRYPFVVALAAASLNRPWHAVDQLRKIDPERGAMRGWVPYWVIMTLSLHMLGKHREELSAARQGRRQYPNSQYVRLTEIRALTANGKPEQAAQRLDEVFSLSLPSNVYLFYCQQAAAELRAHGDRRRALEIVERAVGRYRNSDQSAEGRLPGNPGELPVLARFQLAALLYEGERWQEANNIFAKLALEAPGNVDYQGYLGVTAARLGHRVDALRISKQLAEVDRRHLFGANTLWRARIAAVLGHPRDAIMLLQDAFREGWRFDEPGLHFMDLESVRHDPEFRALIRPKG